MCWRWYPSCHSNTARCQSIYVNKVVDNWRMTASSYSLSLSGMEWNELEWRGVVVGQNNSLCSAYVGHSFNTFCCHFISFTITFKRIHNYKQYYVCFSYIHQNALCVAYWMSGILIMIHSMKKLLQKKASYLIHFHFARLRHLEGDKSNVTSVNTVVRRHVRCLLII